LDPVDCTIRSAKWEDLNHVLSIEEQSFPPEEAFPPWIFINMLKLNPELFIVVDCGNTVKGYAIGVVEDNTCHLISIAIAPGSRLQGLGRKLLRSFESVCKDKGLTSITLEVRIGNIVALTSSPPLEVLPLGWLLGSPHRFGFTSVIWGAVGGVRAPPLNRGNTRAYKRFFHPRLKRRGFQL